MSGMEPEAVGMAGTSMRPERLTAVRSSRRFIQPPAVALVFLLFAGLFFSMAMLDLKRIEGLLLDVLKKKAFDVAEVINQSAAGKYRQLLRNESDYHSLYAEPTLDDQAFSLQEALAGALIELARYIDAQPSDDGPARTRLRELAGTESLRSIAIFNEAGRLAVQTSPLPPDLLAHAQAMVEGRDEIAIHLFHGLNQDNAPSFVGIRRQAGQGAVVLALDREGIEYWAWRIAIRATMDQLQWGSGVVYLAVEDARGRIFARSGSAPVEKVEQCLLVAGSMRDSRGSEPGQVRRGTVQQCVRIGDMKILQISYPFQPDGTTVGTTRVGIDTHETDRLLVENRRHIFLWTGLMVVIGLIAMGALYQTQNRHVAGLQAMQERLHQADRLSSLGQLGAGVAHEIRNPLNAISMAAQRLQRDFAPDQEQEKTSFHRLTQIVRDEIRRLNGIVEDFLGLARSSRMELRRQSVVDLLERVEFLVRDEARAAGIRIEKQWAEPAPMVSMDGAKMEQAVLNIVRNAIESVSGQGCVTLTCDHARRNLACIKIQDTGAGIPAAAAQRIFDPFYTTKATGVGLGLAIAHEIILAHGGEIHVTSAEGAGTTMEILLPSTPAAAGA